MTVAITGEKGFLGYHLTQYYKWVKGYKVISLGKNYLNNLSKLKDSDVLIHCAGVNRGKNIYEKNVKIAWDLKHYLLENDIKINLKFISSIQEDQDNDYGKSKLLAKDILQKYCEECNTCFESYKLPNLFGPFGKPNYNSFVSTFCYNLVEGIVCTTTTSQVELCYVYDAIKVINNEKTDYSAKKVWVDKIYKQLEYFRDTYLVMGTIPKLVTNFDINLFNTFRSFSNSKFILQKHSDERGYLVELVKGENSETQVFYSITKPGVTRGNHFHFNKIERFCVLSGNAEIILRKVGTKEKISYNIKGSDNTVIDMPILHTHNITNVGRDDLICVFWVNKIYDSKNPDTYFNKV